MPGGLTPPEVDWPEPAGPSGLDSRVKSDDSDHTDVRQMAVGPRKRTRPAEGRCAPLSRARKEREADRGVDGKQRRCRNADLEQDRRDRSKCPRLGAARFARHVATGGRKRSREKAEEKTEEKAEERAEEKAEERAEEKAEEKAEERKLSEESKVFDPGD